MAEAVAGEHEARERGFTITRTYRASPQAVFAAWTEPDKLGWFFNPDGPIEKDVEVDLRVGGSWRLTMYIDEDTQYFTGGIYREIVPAERLVFRWGAVDGWPEINPDDVDAAPLVTLTFESADGGGTLMTFHLELPATLGEEQVEDWFATGIQPGWTQTLDRLMPGLRE